MPHQVGVAVPASKLSSRSCMLGLSNYNLKQIIIARSKLGANISWVRAASSVGTCSLERELQASSVLLVIDLGKPQCRCIVGNLPLDRTEEARLQQISFPLLRNRSFPPAFGGFLNPCGESSAVFASVKR